MLSRASIFSVLKYMISDFSSCYITTEFITIAQLCLCAVSGGPELILTVLSLFWLSAVSTQSRFILSHTFSLCECLLQRWSVFISGWIAEVMDYTWRDQNVLFLQWWQCGDWWTPFLCICFHTQHHVFFVVWQFLKNVLTVSWYIAKYHNVTTPLRYVSYCKILAHTQSFITLSSKRASDTRGNCMPCKPGFNTSTHLSKFWVEGAVAVQFTTITICMWTNHYPCILCRLNA